MDVLGRYRNLIVLVGVLFAQVLGLAVQVKRTTDNEPTRLLRIWAVDTVSPFEKALVWLQTSTGNVWHNYLYLRGVRAENRDLKQQIERMSVERVRMSQDADQARRLQALLAFKEQFISKTMAAQVIGSSGSELSRSVYIDKGERDGLKPDMAVITADGIVGKVLRVYGSTSLVLLIDDQTSGVGAILDKTRLQGILRGTPSGEVVVEKVMSDETVPVGEAVLTSGGDGIFPKGLLVGRVTKVTPGSELFLNIHVRPAADLNRLEEVLVVTKIDERQAEPERAGAARAVDVLAARLPGVPEKVENAAGAEAPARLAPGTAAPTATTGTPKAVAPGIGTTTTGAPKTTAPKAGEAASAAADSKPKTASEPKTAPPQNRIAVSPLGKNPATAATSTATAGQTFGTPVNASSTANAATNSATRPTATAPVAATASPKPVKPAADLRPGSSQPVVPQPISPQPRSPKPQPAVADSPN